MLGYGLLSLSFWHGFDWERKKHPMAWLLAVLYAMTDEFHQSFVDGRNPSFWDVWVFDNLGALMALWLAKLFFKQKRPDENA
jgi:VanZ family protein